MGCLAPREKLINTTIHHLSLRDKSLVCKDFSNPSAAVALPSFSAARTVAAAVQRHEPCHSDGSGGGVRAPLATTSHQQYAGFRPDHAKPGDLAEKGP